MLLRGQEFDDEGIADVEGIAPRYVERTRGG